MTDETLTDESHAPDERFARLEQDDRREDRLLWKGALALLGTVLLFVARQRWWV